MKIIFVGLLAMGTLAVTACSDDSGDSPSPDAGDSGVHLEGGQVDDLPKGSDILLDDGPKIDGDDSGLIQNCDKAKVGKMCTEKGGECGSAMTCLTTDKDAAGASFGVCTCSCTPDDKSTPLVNEDTCPGQGTTAGSIRCSRPLLLSDGSSKSFCFKSCAPTLGTNTCDKKLACSPRAGVSVGFFDITVCLIGGCAADADCPVYTDKTCKTASTTDCPTGQKCVPYISGGTDGICSTAGKCDTASGLCGKHTLGKATAKVGDPCKSDTDCDGNMSCQTEFDESKYRKKSGETCTADGDCCSNDCTTAGTCGKGLCVTSNRNGMCVISGCAFAKTLTIKDCGTDAACNILYSGGICQKKCDMTKAAECRGNSADRYGDYECRGWDNLVIGGVKVVSEPVCDFGTGMACDTFGTSSTLDCSSVGFGTTNTTNMACMDIYTGKAKTTKNDPEGYCLDTTSSGTTYRTKP